MFHNSIHDYYQDRPKTNDDDEIDWNAMTLAEFASQFDVVYNARNRKNVITLQNKRGFIVKRGTPCVLRYFLKYENNEEYFRALCILFLPFRNEMRDIHEKNVEILYEDNQEQIESVRKAFEKHRDLVEKIRSHEEKHNDAESEEEEEDPENTFVGAETTDVEDIKQFEKQFKNQAKKSLANRCVNSPSMSPDEFNSKVNSLNQEQQRIFYDFCERMMDVSSNDPFYLYIAGEAGTGKSYLLRLMIEFVNRLPKRSGQELDKPVSITIAPTGVAAYLVDGSTIESALGIQPQSKKNHLSNNQSRNSDLHFLYEDLKVIFLDEVSMVGTDMLAKMNFRMHEIMGNRKFMGNVSIVATGDFGQLPPVGQSMIWNKSNLDGRPEKAPNHWTENFKIFYLKQKMRSQDLQFSNICDKVRKGECDSEVEQFMESRIVSCENENNNEAYATGRLSIIVTNNYDRETINLALLNSLLPDKKSYTVSSSDESTNVRNAPPVDKKLALTQTGQLERQIVFKEGNNLIINIISISKIQMF